MNDEEKLKCITEGLLLAAGKPLSLEQIGNIFTEEERPANDQLRKVLDDIQKDCEGRGFELQKVASGYRFQVRQELGEWVGRLWEEKPQKYSRALMETLAIIAYRQPLTRGDIEKIRGVAVSTTIMRTLLDREWTRVVGHRDVPGRPAMYATTRQFLDYFNLESLDQLPPLSEIRDMEDVNKELKLEENEAPASRVLEIPGEEDEEELPVLDEADEEKVAWATQPLDEILNSGRQHDIEDEAEVFGGRDDEEELPGDQERDAETSVVQEDEVEQDDIENSENTDPEEEDISSRAHSD